MKNKSLIILVLTFALLLGAAYLLYQTLGSQYTPSQQLGQHQTDSTSSSSSDAAHPEKVKAQDITIYNAQNQAIRLSDFEGKPVILSFWADWCSACKGHMPYLNDAYLTYKDDIHFVMLNIPYDQAAITRSMAYLNEQGYAFPFYHDIDQTSTYTYSIEYFPSTFFVDADGYLAGYHIGQLSPELLEQGIALIR